MLLYSTKLSYLGVAFVNALGNNPFLPELLPENDYLNDYARYYSIFGTDIIPGVKLFVFVVIPFVYELFLPVSPEFIAM